MNLTNELKARVETFVAAVQLLNEQEWPNHPYPTTISYDLNGRRYIRIVRGCGCSRSVHCFIDTTNGDILKGSWKAPVARGVRGNVYADDHGLGCVTWCGCKYLR